MDATQNFSNQPQLSEGEMVQFIVENVNQTLSKSYSLVDFDELAGVNLLKLLNDIFGTLSNQSRVDFENEPLENAIQALNDFLLKTLNYKVPAMMQHSFPQAFAQAEKTVMYPVFYWVLKRMPENKKRVYLARFLSRVEIPEDLRMQDDGLRDLSAHYDGLRQEFIVTHKRVDGLREAFADPEESRRKLKALNDERDKLTKFIDGAQGKLSSLPNKNSLVNACHALNVEKEETRKYREKHQEQQHSLHTAQRRQTELANRIKNVRRDLQEGRVETMIQRANDETQTNRMKLDEKLPQELNEKRSQNAALQRVITDPMDLVGMQNEIAELDSNIEVLQRKVAERQRPGDDGNSVVQMKAQVQRVTNKRDACFTELQQLHTENQRINDEIREKENRMAEFRNSNVLKGEDFKRYSMQVTSKTAAVKTMRRRLDDLRGEYGVLQYTDQILRDRHEGLLGDLVEMERKHGAKGFVAAAENLSRVNQKKDEVEQAKGQTLEELSQVVQEFVTKIRDLRNNLAPEILKLRTTRNTAQQIEQEYEDKKQTYEYQEQMMMQEVNKLEAEVTGLTDESKMNETLYHRLQMQIQLIAAHEKRAADEREFTAGTRQYDQVHNTLGQALVAKTQAVETRTKELQKKRREIEDNHENSLQQVEWFLSLKKIMDAKLASIQTDTGNGGKAGGQTLDGEIAAIMGAQSRPGVDMLVLGNN